MICTCDYDAYGAHSGGCYDRDQARMTREMNARIDAKYRAEQAELIQLRMNAAENARLRQQIKRLEQYNRHYLEMAREAYSALSRQLRGEPVEGWLDPQPREEESNLKLKARLNQTKSVSHARFERIKRERDRHEAAESVAKAVLAWAAEASSPPELWAGDGELRMLDAMAVWMITK